MTLTAMYKRLCSPPGILFRFLLCLLLLPVQEAFVYAQASLPNAPAQDVVLQSVISPSAVTMKGLPIDPRDPLRMDFIFDHNPEPGMSLEDEDRQIDALRQIRYFFSSLVIPSQDLWINLSPYEKQRVISDSLAYTGMGKDLLVSDYLLKQVAAELIHPDEGQSREFWSSVYRALHEKFGTTDIPVDTFNKVWITSDSARIYENFSGDTAVPGAAAVVTATHLKVLLEEDYKALTSVPRFEADPSPEPANATRELAARAMREVVIPALEHEVNEGSRFARVREIYRCLVLATWYKRKMYDSVLARVYADSRKTLGMGDVRPISADLVWSAYMDSLRKGVFNLIREETDPWNGETVPRKYMSGGVVLDGDAAMDLQPPADTLDYYRVSADLDIETDAAQGIKTLGGLYYGIDEFERASSAFLPAHKGKLKKLRSQLLKIESAIDKGKVSEFTGLMVEFLKDLDTVELRMGLVRHMWNLLSKVNMEDWLGLDKMLRVFRKEGLSPELMLEFQEAFAAPDKTPAVGSRLIAILVEGGRQRSPQIIQEARRGLLLLRLFAAFVPDPVPLKDIIFTEDIGQDEWIPDPFRRGAIEKELAEIIYRSRWDELMTALAGVRENYISQVRYKKAFVNVERMVADLLFETGHYDLELFLSSYAREDKIKEQIETERSSTPMPLQRPLIERMIRHYEGMMSLNAHDAIRDRLRRVMRQYKKDLGFSDITDVRVDRKKLQAALGERFEAWIKTWVIRFLRESSGFSNGEPLADKLAFILKEKEFLQLESPDILLLDAVIDLSRRQVNLTPERVMGAAGNGVLTPAHIDRWRADGRMGDMFLAFMEIPWMDEEDARVQEEVLVLEALDRIVALGLGYDVKYPDAVVALAREAKAPQKDVREYLESAGKGWEYFNVLAETRTIVRNGRLMRDGYKPSLSRISAQMQISQDILGGYWLSWGVTPESFLKTERLLSINGYNVAVLDGRWVRDDYLKQATERRVIEGLIRDFLEGRVDSNQNALPHIERLQNKGQSISVYVVLSGIVSSTTLNELGYAGTEILNHFVDLGLMAKLKGKDQWVFHTEEPYESFAHRLEEFVADVPGQDRDHTVLQAVLKRAYERRRVTVVAAGPIADFKQSANSNSMPPEFKKFLLGLRNNGEMLNGAQPLRVTDASQAVSNPGGIDLNPDNIRLLIERAAGSGYDSTLASLFELSEETMQQLRQHVTGIVPVIVGVTAQAALTDFIRF